MSLAAPLRIIHTNSARDGSPIIKEDNVELDRMGNMAWKPAFVQPTLVGDPSKVLDGADRGTDTPMSWICSTGVTCAWTDLDPGFGTEGPSKHLFYVGATDMTTVSKGQLTVIFKDDTRKILHPGDIFVNAAGIFRYENNGTETVRLVVFSTPSDTVKIDGKELEQVTGVRRFF
ncbi:uncharacterized protein MKK02DRAFT_40950 [Dioszegia hungarica]|uniref:Uncharacterized protein n=1 Tax=Dioszegia hungarica TaxID=4972 RepID=A0AA38H4T2_9TREE|nr:uncharacterized protein MKK02DRAFT_40950 [Dioszegia hungarica]KAI9632644.1 hypothetical protein MKK02DRAFT_40950 [Dioszegia hungarica]